MFYTIQTIATTCHDLRSKNYNLVLVTGFFDLLHAEHINFLQKAKAQGDILIVAVESDARARKIKGEDRPVETQALRCQKVLAYADYVISLPEDFDHFAAYESLVSAIRPQVYAISSHTSHQKSKQFLVEKYGGKLVVVHEHNPEVSTTQIINSQNNV